VYTLDYCSDCGTASVPPEERGGEGPELYRLGSYAPVGRLARGPLEPLRRLAERDRLRAFRGLSRGAAVLEIGAGDGRFLAALEREGFAVRGIDPFARGDRVEPVSLEEADLGPAAFDAAIFWHVLEHLDDPADALVRAREALMPGGMLVVAVPNAGGLQARLGGDRWFQRDVPRHAVHFTERGLRALVVRSGFEPTRLGHVGLDQAFAMWQTLLNRLTREQDVVFRALKGSLPHRTRAAAAADLAVSAVAGMLLLAPAVALELGAGLARRGGSLVLTARRTGA
jgi:SAM-dependent methyltransferase